MKTRQITAALIVLFTCCMTSTFAEPKGWGVGAGVFDNDFGIHARKDFVFGEAQQFEAVLQGGLYNQDKWTGRFDADFHYIFTLGSTFSLYPLAGFDWAIQSKNNRIGGNLGGGCVIDLNAQTRLFVEAKYVISDWDGFSLSFGVYF